MLGRLKRLPARGVRLARWTLALPRRALRKLLALTHRLLVSRASQYVLPTPSAVYVNRVLVRAPIPPQLTSSEWANRERQAMLDRSLERLRGIEAKGPGLAAINAILAASVVLALATHWGSSDGLGRALLVGSTAYTTMSLFTPIYLVGPQARFQLDGELEQASVSCDPEGFLGDRAAELWALNSQRVTRLANLQDAARNELIYGIVLLVVWAALGPFAGVVSAHGSKASTPSAAPATALRALPFSSPSPLT